MADSATTDVADRSTRRDLRGVASGLLSVVASGARLWWGHWPLLLTIALLGGAGRMAALWAAATVSEHSNTGGVALLVLAPLCSVAAIVGMLHVLRHAMPSLAAAGSVHAAPDVTTGRERRLVDVLASVMVPFLAVYASYGLLAEDTRRYLNTISTQEYYDSLASVATGGEGFDGDRMVFATGWVAVALVLLAMVLRWALARWDRRTVERRGRRSRGLAFAGAYVEVFWMVTLAAHLVLYKDRLWSWVESRRGVDMVIDWWLGFLDLLGPVAGPVDAVVDWALGVVSGIDGLVVVPVAWLTVGAIVYGHRVVPPARAPLRAPVLDRVPAPVRRWGGELVGQVVGDLRSRFTGLVGGLRLLAVAGLGPMLVFGLAFLAAARIEDGLGLLARAVLGPQDLSTWLAFSPHVLTVTRAIGLTVTMSLLAAAVDRVLSTPQSTTRVA